MPFGFGRGKKASVMPYTGSALRGGAPSYEGVLHRGGSAIDNALDVSFGGPSRGLSRMPGEASTVAESILRRSSGEQISSINPDLMAKAVAARQAADSSGVRPAPTGRVHPKPPGPTGRPASTGRTVPGRPAPTGRVHPKPIGSGGRSATSNRLESHLRAMPPQGTKMKYHGGGTPVSVRRPGEVPVTMGPTRLKTPFKGLEASVATSEAKAMQRATPTPISISGVRQGGKMRPLKAPAPTPKPKSRPGILGDIGDFFMKEGKMTTRGKIGLGVAAAVAAGVVMNRRDKGVRPAGPGGY